MRLVPAAERELAAAARWYHAQREELTEELLEEVRHVRELIATNPEVHPPAPDAPAVHPPVRHAILRQFPYRVVFIDRPEELLVLAIAHLKRRPGSWRRRMPS